MIDAIGSNSFSISFQDLSSSSSGQQSRDGSGQRGMAAGRVNNAEATGVRLSGEQLKAVQHRQQSENPVQNRTGASAQGGTPASVGDPHAALMKAQQMRVASQAAADPASQGFRFAAAGSQAQARVSEAIAAYKSAQGETGLALWGTGISLYA